MTGGNKAKPGRGGRGGPSRTITCDDLHLKTIVNSPDPEVLATVQKWDCLEVALVSRHTKKIVVVRKNGRDVGSVTDAAIGNLIDCLNQGHPFKAYVVELSKGHCTVEIQPGHCQ